MTQPGSPVTTVPGFEIQPSTFGVPFVQQLYQLQTTAPERIESVYMTLTYGTIMPTFQSFAIQLWDSAQNVVYEQATPLFTATTSTDLTMVLQWSRQGNDTAQQPFALNDNPDESFARAWANMRLPELVLAPSSTVQFLSWSFFETSSGTIPVSNATVTTTRDAGAVSGTSTLPPLPLLTPTDGG